MWQTVQVIEAELQADRFLVLLCKVVSEIKNILHHKHGTPERGQKSTTTAAPCQNHAWASPRAPRRLEGAHIHHRRWKNAGSRLNGAVESVQGPKLARKGPCVHLLEVEARTGVFVLAFYELKRPISGFAEKPRLILV